MTSIRREEHSWGAWRTALSSLGRLAFCPKLSKEMINQLGDVLLAFPRGFGLHVVGKVVPRLDISRLGENLMRRDDQARDEVPRIVELANKLPENCVDQIERMLDNSEPGAIHNLPFVVLVLPVDEAYASFPELFPELAQSSSEAYVW